MINERLSLASETNPRARGSCGQLRTEFLSGRPQPFGSQLLLERAIARGEIDPDRLTDRIANLPFDLMRHEMLMTLAPVPDDTIAQIVDEIFLPLVTPRSS